MDITATIIHIFERTDRRESVNDLRKEFPQATIVRAFVPFWEERKDTRSIKGSSISHVYSFQKHAKGKLFLALEDDAVLKKKLPKDIELPPDCGVLLLGGETPNVFESGYDGFYEVQVPYHGAHAVLYNTPVLLEKQFLAQIWEAIAVTPLREDAACYEGILDAALRKLDLKIYRLDDMYFSTTETVSERTGQVERARLILKANEAFPKAPETPQPQPTQPKTGFKKFQ